MAETRSTILNPTSPQQGRAFVSAANLASIVEELPDALVTLDHNWRITFANAEARRVSRINSVDLHHRTHWELYPETVGTELETVYRDVMANRVARDTEFHYAPFDLWLDIHITPIDGGIALYYRDISSGKRPESKHNISSRQLAQVFQGVPDAIVCLDRSWTFTLANDIAKALFKADDLIGSNLWTRFPVNFEEPYASSYRTTMEQRIPTEFEAHYPEPLNLWFKVSARPIEDGIIIFATDITDRKHTEAARDATARRLQQVFEATTDGVVSLHWDWTITFLNQQAATVLGREDLTGKCLWDEFPLAVDTEFYDRSHETMERRTPCEFEAFYPEPLNVWFAIQCRPSNDGIVVFFRDVTAERAAKQILLDQQAALSFVQQTARVATWDIDLTTEAMTFSDGSFEVFGHPLSTLKNLGAVKDVVDPPYVEAIDTCIREAIDTHVVTSSDYPVIAADGGTIWVESRGTVLYDANGEAKHLRGMTTDITARKQNEAELLDSEARYRVLADLNPQALWIGSPEGRIVYANQGFLDYIGKTLETIGNQGWHDAFDEADRPSVLAAWMYSVATGEEYRIDAHLTRAVDQKPRWWSLRALPVRNEAGAIQQWLGVAYDIHDLRTTADTLLEKHMETERQRAELETVYRTAPIGLALFDPVDFRYLRVNDRLAEMIGLPINQILGRTISEIAPPAARQILEQVVAERQTQHRLIEGEFPNSPGDLHYFNVNYAPVFALDGSIQAIATATLDITHQKKSEQALIQSEKLAAVGRLASSISHEINNPLEAITNLLYLVAMDESLPEAIKPYVHMAQSELGRVSQIVTQTLRFHRQAVRPTEVTGAELVNAVLNLYQGRLTNSGIRVEAKYVSSTRIRCFENDIRQVLNNLIANAIDAMRNGGRLVVRAHDAISYGDGTSAPRSGVRITIADTGHGMPEGVRARIFEPFYTTKDLNGTGLGLWISSGIVTHHEGRLTVRSSQDSTHHGTVFSLFLPTSGQREA
ncbi:PAS domain-containing protein [Granulicella arctica]|uniref:PAS domain-containing protein n=1 Tax=Granulicella arctica TaxID=940613 RepID=UPI0021E0A437|nr:PAS domain-containing protein [Granulicella arctica]